MPSSSVSVSVSDRRHRVAATTKTVTTSSRKSVTMLVLVLVLLSMVGWTSCAAIVGGCSPNAFIMPTLKTKTKPTAPTTRATMMMMMMMQPASTSSSSSSSSVTNSNNNSKNNHKRIKRTTLVGTTAAAVGKQPPSRCSVAVSAWEGSTSGSSGAGAGAGVWIGSGAGTREDKEEQEDADSWISASTATVQQQLQSLSLVMPSLYSSSSSLKDWWHDAIQPVLAAAILITGNTVGAGCLVMPEILAGPGMASGTILFAMAYVLNVISAMTIANVGITHYEDQQQLLQQHQQQQQRDDIVRKNSKGSNKGGKVVPASPPASFQDLAMVSIDHPLASYFVVAVSIFCTSCVLAFDVGRAGIVGADLLLPIQHLEPLSLSVAWAAGLTALLSSTSSSTNNNSNNSNNDGKNPFISVAATCCVVALFTSFAGLIIPGWASLNDPTAALWQPGTSDDIVASMTHAAPVVLMSMVFQNIIPAVVRQLEYQRNHVVASIALGSAIPLVMYLAWSMICLSGGMPAVGGESVASSWLLPVFSLATLAGSSIGCGVALTNEYKSLIRNLSDHTNPISDDVVQAPSKPKTTRVTFPIPEAPLPPMWMSSSMAVGVPTVAVLTLFGQHPEDCTTARSWAGTFGSPILYGVIPAWMTWNMVMVKNQQQQQQQQQEEKEDPVKIYHVDSILVDGVIGTTITTSVDVVIAA